MTKLLCDPIYSYFTYSGMVPYHTQRQSITYGWSLTGLGMGALVSKVRKNKAFYISSNTTNPCQPIPPYRVGFVILKTVSKPTTTTNWTQLTCHSCQQIPYGSVWSG